MGGETFSQTPGDVARTGYYEATTKAGQAGTANPNLTLGTTHPIGPEGRNP